MMSCKRGRISDQFVRVNGTTHSVSVKRVVFLPFVTVLSVMYVFLIRKPVETV